MPASSIKSSTPPRLSSVAAFVFGNSLLLLGGTVAALAWANLDPAGYARVSHPLHFWVNDVGMAFFFALAAKEVFEATFPGGALASPRRALVPIAAAVGGMIVPALIYVALASTRGPAALLRGWAVIGPGALAWTALYAGGMHPALALVPIVPFMPHSPRDLGLFDAREPGQPDTLNRFEHWWATPVQFVLLLFGFANAGVRVEQIGPGTYYVLASLLIGKPVGILLFSGAARMVGARLPQGLRLADLVVVGIAASIGFTVSLFFATAAFAEGPALAETKMGALLSFVAAPLALIAARLLRVPAAKGQAACP
jgi:Na+/H+ antiporter NhaA